VLGFPTQAFTALAVPDPAAAAPAEEEEAAPAPVVVPAPSAALSLQRLIGGYAVNVSKDFICGPEARYGPDGLVVSAAANTIVSTVVDSGVQNAWPIVGAQYGICPLTVTASRRFTLAAPRAPVGGSATAKSVVKDASLTGSVAVYNTVTGTVVKSLMAVPGAGTTAAAFSACGKWAAVVGKDTGAFNTLYVFYSATAEWTDGVSIASNIVDSKEVSQVAFCGGAAGAIAAPLLMTGGKAVTRFWTLLGGNLSSCAAGEKMEFAVTSCVAQGSGGVVTGHADGTIAFWSGSALAMAVPGAHEGAVTCLTVEGTKLMSGSSDGVKVWEMNAPESTGLTNSAAFSMDSFGAMLGGGALASPFSLRPFVTCVDTDPLMTRMLVSLSSNVTFEFALDSKRAVKIHEGHSAGGITSIAAHPTDPTTVVTVGADKLLKVWDLSQPSGPVVVETHVLVHPPTCAVFKSDGFELAVAVEGADTNGNYAALLIMKYNPAMRQAITPGSSQGGDFTCLTTEVKVHNVGVGKVSAIRYSADSKFVAAVSEDKSVYIYSVETGFKTTGALPGNTAALTGVDFSASGNFVRTFAAMDADTIASGAAVPTVMFFDLGQKTRTNAGTAISLDDLPDGETFATSAGPYCKNTQGLLCCAAGAGARAILGMKTSGTHVLATLSDGSIAITTAAAAAATDTLSAGNGVAHIAGATQADFLAGGEMVVSAGAEGSMAIWTVC
jgi:WD40 repeat protein